MSDKIRLSIWKKIFRTNSLEVNLKQIQKEIIQNGLDHKVEELIKLDIDRSLHNHKDLMP